MDTSSGCPRTLGATRTNISARACVAKSMSSVSAPTDRPAAPAWMPTSARGTTSRHAHKASATMSSKPLGAPGGVSGFTLAEVLVVLIVIGVAGALVYARFDSDPRGELEREGRRLGAAIEHAALLAQWQNETLGVSTVGGRYRFWRRGPNSGDEWSALSGDDVL